MTRHGIATLASMYDRLELHAIRQIARVHAKPIPERGAFEGFGALFASRLVREVRSRRAAKRRELEAHAEDLGRYHNVLNELGPLDGDGRSPGVITALAIGSRSGDTADALAFDLGREPLP